MSTKAKKLQTHHISHAVSIGALIVSTAALLLSLALWNYTLLTQAQFSQSIVTLTEENGRQNHCIELDIMPCTEDEINRRVIID